MATTWTWIGKRKCREIISMCISHVDKIINVAEATKSMIQHYIKGDLGKARESYENVFREEQEADNVKRTIIFELSKGVFHPADREDLLRLTLKSDDVAAYLKATCRRLLIKPDLAMPTNVSKMLLEIADKICEAVKLIKDGIINLYENPRKSIEIADSIERLEEAVDDIRIKVLEKIITWCDTVKHTQCIIAKEVLDLLENAMDACEDVADILRSIAILAI